MTFLHLEEGQLLVVVARRSHCVVLGLLHQQSLTRVPCQFQFGDRELHVAPGGTGGLGGLILKLAEHLVPFGNQTLELAQRYTQFGRLRIILWH
jgi:hypothetical protein